MGILLCRKCDSSVCVSKVRGDTQHRNTYPAARVNFMLQMERHSHIRYAPMLRENSCQKCVCVCVFKETFLIIAYKKLCYYTILCVYTASYSAYTTAPRTLAIQTLISLAYLCSANAHIITHFSTHSYAAHTLGRIQRSHYTNRICIYVIYR